MKLLQVAERPKYFTAIKVDETNLPHAARLISDQCTTDVVRKYIGAYIVKKPNNEVHICHPDDFERFYSISPEPYSMSEVVSALEWAQQQLGKRTRPDPIDDALNKIR